MSKRAELLKLARAHSGVLCTIAETPTGVVVKNSLGIIVGMGQTLDTVRWVAQ